MENLQRYYFDPKDEIKYCTDIGSDGGTYVKFSDMKDILNSTPNTAMPKYPDDNVCSKCMRTPPEECFSCNLGNQFIYQHTSA